MYKDLPLWNFGLYSIRITKWEPHFNPDHDSPIVPIWNACYGLPQQFFDYEAMMSIGNLIGAPVKVDEGAINRTRPHVGKVCIEFDITKPRPERIWLQYRGEGFWQYQEYEGVPDYCSKCFRIGHLLSSCKAQDFQNNNRRNEWRPTETKQSSSKPAPTMHTRGNPTPPNLNNGKMHEVSYAYRQVDKGQSVSNSQNDDRTVQRKEEKMLEKQNETIIIHDVTNAEDPKKLITIEDITQQELVKENQGGLLGNLTGGTSTGVTSNVFHGDNADAGESLVITNTAKTQGQIDKRVEMENVQVSFVASQEDVTAFQDQENTDQG
ncbi:hypothetical protein OROHE_019520 [Orobanche hederae]